MLKQILWHKKSSKKTLPEALKEANYLYGDLEFWTTDEHRIGLQPILRKLWAPKGERPQVTVYPRYEWLYLYAFVRPSTGETYWLLMPYLNTKAFSLALELFAKTRDKHVLLMMDNAAWHKSSKLVIPETISTLFQPPYSPELQPAEHLWQFSDEPLTNQCFDSLDDLQNSLELHCRMIMTQPQYIQRIHKATCFHWLPQT